jgi:hypothetical protein
MVHRSSSPITISYPKLKWRQVDYTQAFPQAELNDPVFMQLPQGWHLDHNGCLQPHPDPKHHDTSHYIQL